MHRWAQEAGDATLSLRGFAELQLWTRRRAPTLRASLHCERNAQDARATVSDGRGSRVQVRLLMSESEPESSRARAGWPLMFTTTTTGSGISRLMSRADAALRCKAVIASGWPSSAHRCERGETAFSWTFPTVLARRRRQSLPCLSGKRPSSSPSRSSHRDHMPPTTIRRAWVAK
ncbi:hypothetical protein NUW54_g12947 [Trametes sanguinea]|uniref:Uncharacterized protein n=1 Tax=Trametes sanguinea TaxID=158606 RepID=A0ACC1MR68_9APHY|nr:hypothetical protein NUW54_g12947 [Trametes sanguinea]